MGQVAVYSGQKPCPRIGVSVGFQQQGGMVASGRSVPRIELDCAAQFSLSFTDAVGAGKQATE